MTLGYLFLSVLTPKEEVGRCTQAATFNTNGLKVVLNAVFSQPTLISGLRSSERHIVRQGVQLAGYAGTCARIPMQK